MSNGLGIIGAGHQAAEVADYLTRTGRYVSFYTDEFVRTGAVYLDAPCFGIDEAPRDSEFLSAIGDPNLRAALVAKVEGVTYVNCVCSDLGASVELGHDVTIAPGCNITVSLKVGSHILINPGCNLGHDTVIGDFTTIAAGVNVGGNCLIERGAFIGIGATIKDRITVGEQAVIGAGAVVIHDVQPGQTVVGVPARPLLR